MAFQFIQLTDNVVGAVETGALLPLGNITSTTPGIRFCDRVFEVSTSGSDTITINLQGHYETSYTGSLIAAEAGLVTLTLIVNGIDRITVSETAAAIGDTVNISLENILRVLPAFAFSATGAPVILQIRNDGVALTGGVSNIIVKKIA